MKEKQKIIYSITHEIEFRKVNVNWRCGMKLLIRFDFLHFYILDSFFTRKINIFQTKANHRYGCELNFYIQYIFLSYSNTIFVFVQKKKQHENEEEERFNHFHWILIIT